MPKTTLIDCYIKKYAYREVSQIYESHARSEINRSTVVINYSCNSSG